MDTKQGVGLIGIGYWGVNYLRVLQTLPNVQLRSVCDKDPNRLSTFSKQTNSPDISFTDDFMKIANDNDITAVIVSTPAVTHFEIVKKMIDAGKHILVEKPITMNYSEAMTLCQQAEKKNKTLMVGHIYCFNPAVNYIKNIITSDKLGHIHYGLGMRLGLGPIRGDASCTWDLATHDIAMLDFILGKQPQSISAQESSFLQREKGIHDYATVQFKYDDGFQFSLTVSWYAAEKIRIWYLMGSKSMLKFDDSDKNTPVTLFDKSVIVNFTDHGEGKNVSTIVPRAGDTVMPYIKQDEPLTLEIKHFIDCVSSGKKPITDGLQGARVIRVLEAIEESINSEGKPVAIN